QNGIQSLPLFPVVIKNIALKPINDPEQLFETIDTVNETYIEILATTFVNALVKLSVCPHYPLVYQPFMCYNNIQPVYLPSEINIIEEFSESSLYFLFSQSHQYSKTDLIYIFFQICTGILAAQNLLEMNHNDI